MGRGIKITQPYRVHNMLHVSQFEHIVEPEFNYMLLFPEDSAVLTRYL